jgi:hypothetical protein
MPKKQSNNPLKVAIDALSDLAKYFGQNMDKDVATNIALDAAFALIAVCVLVVTFPMVDKLELPSQDIIKLGYVVFTLYIVPCRAMMKCLNFFMDLAKKRNLPS